jgi:hypothetical protein
MTKICNKCGDEKKFCEFVKDKKRKSGVRSICLKCESERVKNCYYQNKDVKIKNQKKYVKKNILQVSNYQKSYREKNKEKLSTYIKQYRISNKEKINEREKTKKNNNPIHKLSHIVRNRIRVYLKSVGKKKKNKTFDMIGCTPKQLKDYIEIKFTEGMSWEKIGREIHIDHIKPLSSATNEKELFALCHYTNLQPMWAKENLKKGNKIL